MKTCSLRSFPLSLFILLSGALVAALPARADGDPGAGGDPIGRYLYSPDILLGHAQELALDEAQRKAIRTEVVQAQKQFLDAQLDLQEESEVLARLVQERPVNEAKALAAADRVMGFERTIKKVHLSMLIHLKNLLTPAQIAKMGELQKGSGS